MNSQNLPVSAFLSISTDAGTCHHTHVWCLRYNSGDHASPIGPAPQPQGILHLNIFIGIPEVIFKILLRNPIHDLITLGHRAKAHIYLILSEDQFEVQHPEAWSSTDEPPWKIASAPSLGEEFFSPHFKTYFSKVTDIQI